MKSFNVLIYNFNSKNFEPYDVIPYLESQYKKAKPKPKTYKEFKEFIKKESHYQWWSRCEYEIILNPWPPDDKHPGYKLDVHEQVMMNIEVITTILMKKVLLKKAGD